MKRGPKPIHQDAILAVLHEADGAIVETHELVRRAFGPDALRDTGPFRMALHRLRRRMRGRLPEVEVEAVTGYRLLRRRPAP